MRTHKFVLTAALTAACALPFAAFAQSTAASAPARPSMFDHMLKKMDTDGDGKISSAEFQAAAAARFAAIDTQGTGKITAEQIASSKPANERAEKFADREVAKIGTNGVITKDQYLAAAQAHFAKLDKNGDGYITADELPAGRWAPHKNGAANPQ